MPYRHRSTASKIRRRRRRSSAVAASAEMRRPVIVLLFAFIVGIVVVVDGQSTPRLASSSDDATTATATATTTASSTSWSPPSPRQRILRPRTRRRQRQQQPPKLSSFFSDTTDTISGSSSSSSHATAPHDDDNDDDATRQLTATSQVQQYYTNSTLLRDNAVRLYQSLCPDFVWNVKKLKKGGSAPCSSNPSSTSTSVSFTKCGYTHVLRRYGIIIGSKATTFQYLASRNGVPYRRMLSMVCPYDRRICTVMNVWCASLHPPTRRPTRFPTAAPTPTTRSCTSCLTQQNWTCPYAETCGCNVGNCLPVNTSTLNCSCQTMVPVPWNSNFQATIELCQDATNTSIYGYRLPGEDSCHLAALMIRVVPGNQYRLTIRNGAFDNVTTNLHTHGIHISGNGNSDNPMRTVASGNCITYHWDIPSDHMGGTHWMHSHDMQQGYIQVNGGALALFVVEENPSLLSNVDSASQPGIQAWLQNELLLVATRTLVGHRGNGLSNAQLNMTQGEWYRLRILGAEIDGNEFYLRLPAICTIYTVAHDGVWRFDVPNQAAPPTDGEYRMTSAGRLDVAINCPKTGSYPITAVSSVIPNSVIATLNVRSGTRTIATPFTSTGATWMPSRPSYLQNLLDPSVTVDNQYDIIISYSSVNGKKYQMDDPPLDNFTYGSVQEWTVTNAAKPHSYHQHIHHFQVVSCPGFDSGEFYDTILPTTNLNPCVLRFRVSDYSGNLFLHCHTIAHSEMGAMARFLVTDGGITNGNEDYDAFVC